MKRLLAVTALTGAITCGPAVSQDEAQRNNGDGAIEVTRTLIPQYAYTCAGVTPTSGERSAAINEFAGAATSEDTGARGRALRKVAEHSTLAAAEFNRAFVLMQYFGYLRRNPNDPQDTDYTGYDFWLTKLNQFNGNFVNAEMVKAFITAGEYRNRFGP